MAPDLAPRVHCVWEVESRGRTTFASSLSRCALLYTSPEARYLYISETKSVFAFETYINFATDTIYFPGIGGDDIYATYRGFLRHPDSSKIRKLALRPDAWQDLSHAEDTSVGAFFPSGRFLPTGEIHSYYLYHGCRELLSNCLKIQTIIAHFKMRKHLRRLRELTTVFRDDRPIAEVLADWPVEFRDLSSREKRSGIGSHAVMFIRQLAKWVADLEVKKRLTYRFAVVDSAATYDI